MKKLFVILLVLSMVFSLAACTGNQQPPAAQEQPEQPEEPEQPESPSEDGDKLVIGLLQDITGKTATLGKMIEAGVKYAVEELNAAGGINGKPIEVITRDTTGDVTVAVNAFELLCTQDKVNAIVGPPVANIGLAIAPISELYDVPVLGFAIDPNTLQKEDGTTYKNMFLLQPSDKQQGEIMAKYAIEELGSKKIGIIFRNDNAYSVGISNAFRAYVKATDVEGVEIVEEVEYKSSDTDFSTMLMKLMAAGADTIFAPNYTQELITITQQARAIGYQGRIINGLDAAPPFASLAGDAANGVIYINNITESDPKIAEIMKIYKDKTGVDATNKFFLGHDVTNIIYQIVQEVGTDPVAIRDAVENLSGFEGLTGVNSIDPKTHQAPGLEMYVHEIVNGESVMIKRYATD
ncbi:MAG TPA: ABC transporter substrate-binding protein [Sedimentibacter sp.]|jgi:branched-chain amino acid transport system substrate-binding protein|nr:ABC transporter substrate-binding protein [Clostridiales bacterium]HQO71180.1 ABC transporter substrate-binding protein [Sedimentibacter sp.]